ncbi:MAG: non-canonical purine NTP pyrophosphatase [Zetaproteobacteria bacterium]|nr:non-canonical purine NTP pyrophosphatase [Zetaproteobacteria bacterium]
MSLSLFIASGNRGKVTELGQLCGAYFEQILCQQDLLGTREVAETGSTLFANARLKCDGFAHLLPRSTFILADDSGLFIDALGGRPGVYSKRYAGAQGTDQQVMAKILAEMAGLPWEQRGAVMRCVLAVRDHRGRKHCFEGSCPVWIPEQPRGTQGFSLDPILQPRGATQTFAQMSAREKSHYDHRGRAIAAFIAALEQWRQRGYL